MKVAKLVYASFVTRVVVDANATEEQILDSARKQFAFKVENELSENIEAVSYTHLTLPTKRIV